MNKEKNMKPMTLQEEYRNADVPMPKEDIEAMENAGITYTDVIKNSKSDEDYKGGGAYKAIMEMFANQLDDKKFVEHCKKFFKGGKK
jgi:hypothetical protein